MKHSYLNRILYTYTMIIFVILFLIFMGFFSYIWNYSQNQVQQTYINYFQNFVKESEEVLSTMNYMAATVSAMKSLDLFVYSNDQNYFQYLTSLYRDLSSLNQKLAEKDCQVAVHKINDSTVISSTSSISLPYFLTEFSIEQKQYQEILEKLLRYPFPLGYFFITDDKIVYVTSKDYQTVRMVILVFINRNRINNGEALPGMKISYKAVSDDVVDLRETKPVSDYPVPGLKPEDRDYSILNQIRKGSNLLFWTYSNRMGISYFFTIDNSIKKDLFKNIAFITIGIFVFICGLAYFIILFFSKRIYRPIEHLMNSFIDMGLNHEMDMKSKSELDFMAGQVVKIRNYNQELIKTLENNNRYNVDNVIYELLTGSYNRDTIYGNLKRMSIEWLNRGCSVVIFTVENNANRHEESKSLLSNKLLSLIGKQFSSSINYVSILYPGDIICFILNQINLSDLRDTISRVISVIDTAISIHFSAIIGSPGMELKDIQRSFNSAYTIMENFNSSEIKEIYDYNDLKNRNTIEYIIPFSLERQLLGAVESHNIFETERLIDIIHKDYISVSFEKKESREPLIFAMGNTIYRAMQKTGIITALMEPDGKTIYSILLSITDQTLLMEQVKNYFRQIIDEMETINEIKIGKLKQNLEDYIERNLKENISLIDISQHFNLSPSYMSNIFKQNLNENFRDYLSRRRFEVAAGILKINPEKKLSDIAEEVGLNNVNTLIRTFHKFTGMSPGKFIENNLKLQG